MDKRINSLIEDWELAAKNHLKKGGSENFWKADIYKYCTHRLKSVTQHSVASDGEIDVPCCDIPGREKCDQCQDVGLGRHR